jgi:hypothetical protein
MAILLRYPEATRPVLEFLKRQPQMVGAWNPGVVEGKKDTAT